MALMYRYHTAHNRNNDCFKIILKNRRHGQRWIVKGIANGLEYLHSKIIILRDLKLQNIGFHSSGEVKLFDIKQAKKCNTKQQI
jgi:serine/threonine protein kinase